MDISGDVIMGGNIIGANNGITDATTLTRVSKVCCNSVMQSHCSNKDVTAHVLRIMVMVS
jgi:hypothetical protein